MTKRIAWLATASLLPFVCGGMVHAQTAAPEPVASAPTAKPAPAEKVAQATKPHKVHQAKKAPRKAAARTSEVAQLRDQLNSVLARLKQVETCYQKIPQPPCPPQVCPGECPPLPECCPPKPMVQAQDGRQGIALTGWVTDNRYKCIRVHLSGQVNKAAWAASNGHRANLQIVDNNTSSTRFTLWVEGDVSPCLTFGGVIMEEINQNPSNRNDIGAAQSAEVSPTTRKAEVYSVHKDFGTLYLGHGYMASFLSMQDTDFTATTAASAGAKVNLIAGGVTFFDKSSGAKSSGLAGVGSAYTVGRVFDNCDGLNRQDRIRFDTKSIGGFSLQGSYAYTNVATMWDAGVRYANSWGKTKVGVSVFYEQNNAFSWTANANDIYAGKKTNARYRQVNGSAGVLFENGISLMGAGSYRKWDVAGASNAWLGFGKIGYQTKFFCEGLTAFAVNGGYWKNFAVDSRTAVSLGRRTKGTTFGATVVQFFDRANTELYLTAQTYKLKLGERDEDNNRKLYKAVNVALLGARISF